MNVSNEGQEEKTFLQKFLQKCKFWIRMPVFSLMESKISDKDAAQWRASLEPDVL